MDLAEFEGFIRQYEKDVFSFCRYLAMDDGLAEDLYQDTVLHAFEALGRIDAGKNPKAFLFSIAIGKWKNARRKAGRRNAIAPMSSRGETAAGAGGMTGGADGVYGSDGDGNPEASAQRSLLRDCIHEALARMDDKHRIPLILFYFDDCGVEAISRLCKIPQGTVKSRLHKGRALLREVLEKEGFGDGWEG